MTVAGYESDLDLIVVVRFVHFTNVLKFIGTINVMPASKIGLTRKKLK